MVNKDLTYNLIDDMVDSYKKNLHKTLQSLCPISIEKRNTIATLCLRIAEKKYGKTLAELSERTGYVWDDYYTGSIFNQGNFYL